MGAIALGLLKRFLPQILLAVVLIVGYFSWKHHIETVQREKDRAEVALRDADTARQSAELMAAEKSKVEKLNNEQNERLQNAITIYADRASNLNDDVANLTNRLRNNRAAASCDKNPMSGTSDDNGKRKERDREADTDIARAAIELANMCELQINKLPVAK